MSVLILTTADNRHADAVEHALNASHTKLIRFNFNPESCRLLGFSSGSDASVNLNGLFLSPKDISSVFVHHPLPPNIDFKGSDPLDNSLIKSSWRNSLDYFEGVFRDANWINLPSQSRVAASTLLQLQTATRCRMRIPETLFTNDLKQLEAFASRHNKTIIKAGPLPGVNLQGHRLLTQLVDVPAIHEDNLSCSPCLFQEYINKAFELRVHVIGDQVYACKIDSQRCPETLLDWRNYRIAATPHSCFELDDELANACRAITAELGLKFGILDIVMTPANEPVFLECNSQGYWLWIEELTGLPITATLAKTLAGV